MSKQINLFNPALLRQEPVCTAVTMVRALGVLLVGMALLAVAGQRSVARLEQQVQAGEEMLKQRKARQAIAAAEFGPRRSSPELAQRLAAMEAQLRSRRAVADLLQRGQNGHANGYSPYMKALARQSSDALWLTGLTIAGPGHELTLRGRAFEADLVPAYIGRLKTEPVMQGKSFGSLQMARPELKGANGAATQAPFVDFSLRAESPGAPGAAAEVTP